MTHASEGAQVKGAEPEGGRLLLLLMLMPTAAAAAAHLEEVGQVHAEALEDLVAQCCGVGLDPRLERLLRV